MLARSFKTADELKIDGALHAALVKVLGMLEREELKYCTIGNVVPAGVLGFNMALYFVKSYENYCGSIGCIAGYCHAVDPAVFSDENGKFSIDSNKLSSELVDLFWAAVLASRDNLTVAQAAAALANYLTTGAPRWDEV